MGNTHAKVLKHLEQLCPKRVNAWEERKEVVRRCVNTLLCHLSLGGVLPGTLVPWECLCRSGRHEGKYGKGGRGKTWE